jgi:hypothetical protein
VLLSLAAGEDQLPVPPAPESPSEAGRSPSAILAGVLLCASILLFAAARRR